MVARGIGGKPKDKAMAYGFYSIAARDGDPDAQSAADNIKPKLTSAQLIRVKKVLKE